MLSFLEFIIEEQKKSEWINQYNDVDDKRIGNLQKKLFNRGMNPKNDWEYFSTEYGSKDLGPNNEISKRHISLVMVHKKTGQERKLHVKPDVERNPGKYKLKSKPSKKMN